MVFLTLAKWLTVCVWNLMWLTACCVVALRHVRRMIDLNQYVLFMWMTYCQGDRAGTQIQIVSILKSKGNAKYINADSWITRHCMLVLLQCTVLICGWWGLQKAHTHPQICCFHSHSPVAGLGSGVVWATLLTWLTGLPAGLGSAGSVKVKTADMEQLREVCDLRSPVSPYEIVLEIFSACARSF